MNEARGKGESSFTPCLAYAIVETSSEGSTEFHL